MKENKYDDDIFFEKYSQMRRSQQGLAVSARINVPELLKLRDRLRVC